MDDVDHANKIIQKDMESMITNSKNSLKQGNETGLCVDCEAVISYARMTALPGCLRCINCQNDLEGN